MNAIPCTAMALLGALLLTQAQAETPKVHQVARKAERPAGAPEYADVCFRYGWIRTGSFPTVEDAKKAMADFHATRVDWFYPGRHDPGGGVLVSPESKAFIDWCHAQDMKIGGAINNNTTDEKWAYRRHHLDRFVGEVKNEEFRKQVVEWGKAQIDAGVDTMVCDDIFKYDKERQDLWSKEVLAKIVAHKPGFTMAGNSGHSISTEYVERFVVDFHYSDNNFVPKPGVWWAATKAHRHVKSALLLHPNRHITAETRRRMIALGYANGAQVITPWDEYIHGKKRLFAAPADFSDLYGFARALGQEGWLNGHEDAAVGGYDLKETRYGNAPPIAVSGGSGKASTFARAQPGNAAAPVVIHLVEWGEPKPFQLKLRPEAFFVGSKPELSLRLPVAYDAATHAKASESKDYRLLSQTLKMDTKREGEWLVAEIPALVPWGVLVVSGGSGEMSRAGAEPYPLWSGGAIPKDPMQIPEPDGLVHRTIHRPGEKDDKFLHGAAVIHHDGVMHANWANSPKDENGAHETLRGRRSGDGGETWSALEIVAPGFDGDECHSHGVYHSHKGKLWTFCARFDGSKGKFPGLTAEAFVLDPKNDKWESRGVVMDNCWPYDEPVKMADGNWITGGQDKQGLPVVAISQGDDFARKWKTVLLPYDPALKPNYAETTVWADGEHVIAVIRGGGGVAWVSTSDDCGRTWTKARRSNYPMPRSKAYLGKLSTGQLYLVANHGNRDTMVVAVGKPGEQTLSSMWRIRHGSSKPVPRFSGAAKSPQWSYPYAHEHDGKLFIVYSIGKEDCGLSVIPIESLAIASP